MARRRPGRFRPRDPRPRPLDPRPRPLATLLGRRGRRWESDPAGTDRPVADVDDMEDATRCLVEDEEREWDATGGVDPSSTSSGPEDISVKLLQQPQVGQHFCRTRI